MTRIPVTILGGYLGAGKTTLINKVLAQESDQRLAVFVNDFGEINIDATLIESRNDNVVALTNGCVCCSIGDDLGKAVFELLQSDTLTDHIVIEASGAADPARVAGYTLGDTRLGAPHVITLADAETVRTRAKDKFVGKLVQRQIKAAHLIALSKTDLVSPSEIEPVQQWVSDLAPDASVINACDLSSLLIQQVRSTASADNLEAPPPFTTFTFECAEPLIRDRFEEAIQSLPPAIWRAKGFVSFDDGQRLVFQKVGSRWSLSDPTTKDGEGTALVFISTIPAAESAGILEKLQACMEK